MPLSPELERLATKRIEGAKKRARGGRPEHED